MCYLAILCVLSVAAYACISSRQQSMCAVVSSISMYTRLTRVRARLSGSERERARFVRVLASACEPSRDMRAAGALPFGPIRGGNEVLLHGTPIPLCLPYTHTLSLMLHCNIQGRTLCLPRVRYKGLILCNLVTKRKRAGARSACPLHLTLWITATAS